MVCRKRGITQQQYGMEGKGGRVCMGKVGERGMVVENTCHRHARTHTDERLSQMRQPVRGRSKREREGGRECIAEW